MGQEESPWNRLISAMTDLVYAHSWSEHYQALRQAQLTRMIFDELTMATLALRLQQKLNDSFDTSQYEVKRIKPCRTAGEHVYAADLVSSKGLTRSRGAIESWEDLAQL